MKNTPNFSYENKLSGIIAGIDEAGRGALAGPVVAAAVIIDRNHCIKGIKDSKKLSSKTRFSLYEDITSHYKYAIGVASVTEIDQLNILHATNKAIQRAITSLNQQVTIESILLDGNHVPEHISIPTQAIVKGDNISVSIAAASIIAKVTRDLFMMQEHLKHPRYNWQQNKGYGTAEHIKQIMTYGPNNQHRTTFAPIKNLLATANTVTI